MTFEDRLRDRFSTASESLPGRPLDWAETHARARRGRTIYLAAVAFGTAVAVAAGGFGTWALLDERGDGRHPVAPAQTETAEPEPSPSPSDGLAPGDVSFEASFRAVENFIEAAADGDAHAMWAEMSENSKAVYDRDLGRFRQAALSEIQEGWGSWAAADDLDMQWQVISSSDDGAVGIVTLLGSRAPEGDAEPYASAAIPVRVGSDDDAKLELFVSRGLFEFHTPRDLTVEQPPALDSLTVPRASFEVFVPGRPAKVFMVVAPVPDEPAFSAHGNANIEDGDKNHVRAVWRPKERLFPGEWFVTVAAVYLDGSMQADSVRFSIE